MIETELLTSVVSTRHGKVRGTHANGVHAFKGIPYAAPPFGPNRLRPPQPVDDWTGVREAIHDGLIPPQPFALAGSAEGDLIPSGRAVPGEDCLNLNIWTPELGSARLPVMLWITGGMFEVGAAGWYDGSHFARDGVVCVSINYRVGAEGFLLLSDAIANRGLLDQIAAMEWVRDNIAAFGGDPDNVTICGESAGAMSIGVLLAVPRARGLFHRAIAQSGAAHHVLPKPVAMRISAYLAGKLGVAPNHEAMAGISKDRMLAAQIELKTDLMAQPDPERWGMEVVASVLPFQPVVDGDVIPSAPLGRIKAGTAARVDVLIGTNVDDWRLFLAASGAIGQITKDVLTGEVAKHGYLSAAAYGLPVERALTAYRSAYPAATPGGLLAALQTDWWCRIPAIRLADAHVTSAARTYMYEFGWRSPVGNGLFGACHALEIPFVFDTLDAGPSQMLGNLLGDNPPQALANTMHAAWVSFISRGDPGWSQYELARRATMRFDTVSRVVDDPRSTERVLWEGVR
jgi:para-nitrobenzyl esterase